ncbi:MAG: hypothetical protein ACJ70X_08680, partial [Nitrososphaera sp.]
MTDYQPHTEWQIERRNVNNRQEFLILFGSQHNPWRRYRRHANLSATCKLAYGTSTLQHTFISNCGQRTHQYSEGSS